MTKKFCILFFIISLLSFGSLSQAYGDDAFIGSVPLSFSWDKTPKAGDLVGALYATSSSRQFVVEGVSYTKRDDTWVFGEKPMAEIELSARGGYRFKTTDRTCFTLFGCGVQYKKATMDFDGNSLTLQVTFPTIDSILPSTTAVSWDDNTAVWDDVDGSKSYEVELYKDKRLLSTVKAKHSNYDFKPYINVEGNYTFRVRAFGTYRSQASPWSDLSEDNNVRSEDAWYIDNGSWERNRLGRRYVYKNKAYPSNAWRCINSQWYYFNNDGYIRTNCYVKSDEMKFYYYLGPNGVWDSSKDTFSPDFSKFTVIR